MASEEGDHKAWTKVRERVHQAGLAEKYPLAARFWPFLVNDSVDNDGLEAAQRIARQSGLSGVDNRALWQAVRAAHASSEVIDKYRRSPRATECMRELMTIHAATKDLLALLFQDNDATNLITDSAAEFVLGIHKLEALVNVLYEQFKEIDRQRGANGREVTAKEWLSGVELPCVYAEFSGCALLKGFPVPAGMVQFVHVSLNELGISYAPASIKKAIGNLETMRASRLKTRTAGQNPPPI